MKILSSEQIRDLDKYTIEHEPVASSDLMERAAAAVFTEVSSRIKLNETIYVFCGMGNNGGDGLAVARMLITAGYLHVSVFVVKHSPKASKDFLVNEERLKNISGIRYIETENQIPKIPKGIVIIDAIFGTGLNKPVTGLSAPVIKAINRAKGRVYSIDVPSGLFSDQLNGEKDFIVCSQITYTFHAPKLTFLLPANGKYVPEFKVLDIGLSKEFEEQLSTDYNYIDHDWVQSFFKKREKFSHKGTYGHALIIAGSFGKIGAAVLATKAALRSGAGLVNALIPVCGYDVMQTSNPEAMVNISGDSHLYDVPDLSPFNAVGVGPGVGMDSNVYGFMDKLLNAWLKPLVLDADALNILAEHKKFLKLVPENSILTPHPGEFKRLVGDWKDDLEKLKLQVDFSKKYKVALVLKGAHTSISTPEGKIYFNSTGNAGMAKGGSGDVLTGIITSLMAQKYTSVEAAMLGIYIHGLAGDIAAQHLGETGMKAGDIIYYLPKAFKTLEG